ncbi:YecA family protein [Legionella drancourtii]|uniref:SEC-C motif domain protein n=1 Tax=Legionella drancourtii LLAP12 TaxID=658187 RepID=G9ERT3_9GAMM|nr:hypothetical protein [Legionella drancourtii]EHL30001.1 hypothetical protein LDG_8001 [Legionella drancourtii LLAP12]
MKNNKTVHRAHRKCSCGSKRKYRNCCGKTNTVNFQDLSPELQKFVRETQIKYQISTKYHQEYFGFTPEIQSCVFQGKRMVILGNSIVVSDHPEIDWRSPAEFLSSNLKTTLGNDWFESEANKPESDRHIIIKWCTKGPFKVIDSRESLEVCQLSGNELAYLHLAYDLFVLINHNYLIDNLVKRLKVESSFNGARYELFVLATMIRAGFKLKPFDETLGLGRVTECQATHIQTGEIIQVEAKARDVKGVLGAKQGKRKNIDLYRKLRNAVEKEVDDPYIVFVDVNMPELDIYNDRDKIDKIRGEYKKLEEKFPEHLPNIVCFTNIPFHYGREDNQLNSSTHGIIISHRPKVKFKNQEQIVASLRASLDKYQFLPKKFDESREFAESFFPQ